MVPTLARYGPRAIPPRVHTNNMRYTDCMIDAYRQRPPSAFALAGAAAGCLAGLVLSRYPPLDGFRNRMKFVGRRVGG